MRNITRNNKFKLLNLINFQGNNEIIIRDLYMPLVGKEAADFYINLAKSTNDVEYESYEYFFQKNNIDRIDTINEILEKLEAVRLIETYASKTSENIAHKVKFPLDGQDFFDNVSFKGLLFSKVEQEIYLKLKLKYKGNSESLTNVTNSFHTIFKGININHKIVELEKINSSYDYLSHKHNIKLSREDKKFIANTISIYGIEEDEIVNLVLSSYSQINGLDENSFRDNASKINLDIPENLENVNKNESRKFRKSTIKGMEDLYNFTPSEYLGAKLNSSPTKSDLYFLEKIIVNYHLNTSVINLLIAYSFSNSNEKRFNKNLIEKIAQDLHSNKIKDAENAYTHIKGFKSRIRSNSTVSKKVEPEWTKDDYVDNASSNIDTTESASSEEIANKLGDMFK